MLINSMFTPVIVLLVSLGSVVAEDTDLFGVPPLYHMNTECITAEPYGWGSSYYSTENSTVSDVPACGDASEGVSPGVWFVVSGSGNMMTASTCWSEFDTQLSVLSGTCDNLVCVAGNDNFCGENGTQSSVTWQTEPMEEYYVYLHGASPDSIGWFSFEVLELLPPPTNDECAGAWDLVLGETRAEGYPGMVFATPDSPQTCGNVTDSESPGVWFSVQGTGGLMYATTCTESYMYMNTQLSVYAGACDTLTCVDGNSVDAFCSGMAATVTWESDANSEYYILLNGASEWDSKDFYAIRVGEGVAVMNNDNCYNPDWIYPGMVSRGITSRATVDVVSPCGDVSGSEFQGLWYSFSSSGTSQLFVTTCASSNLNTQVFVYVGYDCGSLECVPDGTYESCGTDAVQGSFSWRSEYSETYYIFVSGSSNLDVEFQIEVIEILPPPLNDNCSSAIDFPFFQDIYYDSTWANPDSVPSCSSTSNSSLPGIWFLVTGTGNFLNASSCVYPESQLSVFTGSCDSLICVEGAYSSCGYGWGEDQNQNSFRWESDLNTEYYVFARGQYISLQVVDERPVPENDDCSSAIGLQLSESYQGYTVSATVDVATGCGEPSSPGVWFSFLGTGNFATASTCNSDFFDTKLSVFEGDCSDLICIEDNDDSCSTQSAVTWETESNKLYYVLVYGFGTNMGEFVLDIYEGGLVPMNDICLDAEEIWTYAAPYGTLTWASLDATEACDGSSKAAGVWYRIYGTGYQINASPCHSVATTQISVYTGSCDDLECVDGEYDTCESNVDGRSFSWQSEDVLTYYILVSGEGDFSLDITESLPATNEVCSDAEQVWLYDYYGDGASGYVYGNTDTAEVDDIETCGTEITGPGIWYFVNGTGNVMEAKTCGYADFDTMLSVFTGSCENLICVDGNDDGCDTRSYVTWPSDESSVYYILVHGFSNLTGDFQLEVGDAGPPPMNDVCYSAEDVFMNASFSGYLYGYAWGSTESATADNVDACSEDTNSTGPGIWFSVNGTGTMLRATIVYASFDTKLSVFTGGCDVLLCVGGNDDAFYTERSSVAWQSDDDTMYYILVHSFGTAFGDFDLDIVEIPSFDQTNDNCSDATNLALNTVTQGHTLLATMDDYNSTSQCNITGPGVWYTVSGTGDPLHLRVCADYDIDVLVYIGDCESLTCLDEQVDADGIGFDYDSFNSCDGWQKRVAWLSEIDVTYYVSVQGYNAAGVFDIELKVPDINDDCADAFLVDASSASWLYGSTHFASSNTVPSCLSPGSQSSLAPGSQSAPRGPPPGTSPGVWYLVSGTGSILQASTCSDYEPFLTTQVSQVSVFTGDCNNLECLVFDWQCSATWQSESNVMYYILVEAFGTSAEGNFELIVGEGPSNGNCIDAIPLSIGFVEYGNTLLAPQNFVELCGETGSDSFAGVWYSFVGTGAQITASLCDYSFFDTQISLFGGTCESLICLDGNDDACGGTASEITWTSDSSITYYIFVHGFGGATGDFGIRITEADFEVVSGVDECNTALALQLSTPIYSSTETAKVDKVESCGLASPGTAGGVWYKVVGTGGILSASTCGSFYDTQLSVFTGDCDNLECVVDNDDDAACGFSSVVGWKSNLDTTYFILVHGYYDSIGIFRLLVESITDSPANFEALVVRSSSSAPKNSNCADAKLINSEELHRGSTAYATQKAINGCGGAGESTAPGLWHSITGTGNSMLVSTCSSFTNFDTQISVFMGSCNGLVCVDGNDDSCGSQSSVSFESQLDVMYFVVVHGQGNQTGDFGLKVESMQVSAEKEGGQGQEVGDSTEGANVDASDGTDTESSETPEDTETDEENADDTSVAECAGLGLYFHGWGIVAVFLMFSLF